MENCCSNGYAPYVNGGECRFCFKSPNVVCDYSPFIKNGDCRFCYKTHKTNKSCKY